MKSIIVALSVIFSTAAFAKPILKCSSHNSVFVTLETAKDGFISGRMNHNYNGANLACKMGAMETFEMTGEMNCVGLWNMAFNQNGEMIELPVVITIKKTGNSIKAMFENNWDGRSSEETNSEILNCL